MFRIGEFSRLTQVSIRMLRYYDDMKLLKPAEIDLFTGYRMYSAEQIPILQKIVLLRDSKFKVSEIKAIILKNEEINIAEELEKKKNEIMKQIYIEKQRIIKIDNTINEIVNNNFNIHCNINFKKVDKILIISLRDTIPTYFHEGNLWKKLSDYIKTENISIKHDMYNNVAIYHDTEHKDRDVEVEVGIIVDKLGENKYDFKYREVGSVERMAYAMVYGPYKNLAKGYEMLAYYLEKHNEQMDEKPSRQICHIGVEDTKNQEEYLTEIQIPLK